MKDPIIEICENIWALEKSEDLLMQKIRGVFFWKLVRFAVFKKAAMGTGAYDLPHPKKLKSVSPSARYFEYFKTILRAPFRSPFFGDSGYKYIVMPHMRQHQGTDIYSRRLRDQLPDHDTLVLYNGYDESHDAGVKNISAAMLWERARRRLRKQKVSFTKDEIEMIHHIENKCESIFKFKMGLHPMIEKAVRNFDIQTRVYSRILARHKPDMVYLICAYGHEAMIHAAQEKGLPVIELQHGVITPNHMGYSYPGRPFVPYSPDVLLFFGAFWMQNTDYAKNTKGAVMGYDFMQQLKHRKRADASTQVLALSQGPTGAEMFRFVHQAAGLYPEINFVYRPHPSEFLETYEQALSALGDLKNLRLSGADEDTYALMLESKAILGVNSTAVFEGVTLGCQGMVLNLPGVEYMRSAILRGDITLINTPGDFIEAFHKNDVLQDKDYYFAPPVDSIPDIAKEALS